MYNDIADAVESYKEKGFTHTFELADEEITCEALDATFVPDQLTIVESYTYDKGTDPGSESTVYALKSDSGVKGLLIIPYGMYADPDKAHLIDQLLDK